MPTLNQNGGNKQDKVLTLLTYLTRELKFDIRLSIYFSLIVK